MKKQHGKAGFSAIELLIVLTAVLIFAGVAVPQLMPVRTAANEGSAIATVRHLMSAEASYSATHPGEVADLEELLAADLVDERLSDAETQGYRFEIEKQGNTGYSITATPTTQGDVIQRSFYGDHTGVIRSTNDGSRPTAGSSALSGGPSLALIPRSDP